MDAQDLTHAEAVLAAKSLRDEVGPNAEVYIELCTTRWAPSESLRGAIYPNGVGKSDAVRAYANTYAAVISALKAEWAKHADTASAKTIRDMALKIISITADEGTCSELSLCRAFSAGEVKTYGDRACEEATRIAGNGPFSIVRAASQSEAA
jgi:hypothetical protein